MLKLFPSGALIVLLWSVGCAREDGSDALIRRGSAGEWSITDPVVILGSKDNDILHSVRAAFRTADGTLVVADGSSRTIREYGEDGALLSRYGRPGSGPGEFNALVAIWPLSADTVLAYDSQRQRLSYWLHGALVREVGLQIGPREQIVGTLNDGQLVVFNLDQSVIASVGTTRTDSATLRTVSSDGDSLHTLISLPWQTRHRAATPDGNGFTNVLPLFPTGVVYVADETVIVGTGSQWMLSEIAEDGRNLHVYQNGSTPPILKAEHKSKWMSPLLERPGLDKRVMSDFLSNLPYPTSLPAFDRVLCDDDGFVWVRHFSMFDSDSSAWTVFARRGQSIGVTMLPSNLRPTHIGRDFLVGVLVHEDDTQTVALLGLSRPANQ